MQLTEHILTQNDCWKAGQTITPLGVMVHSPGVAQPDVDVFLRTWNQPGVERCAHAFVARGGVTQTLPWNWRGWHAGTAPNGGRSANNTHIGFEILEPAGHTYRGGTMIGYDPEENGAYFADVYQNAVELTALLCRQYGLDPMQPGVVISHNEGYALDVASNHSDVMQWFPKHNKSMDLFRADVRRVLEGGENEMTQAQFDAFFRVAMSDYLAGQNDAAVSSWAGDAWEKATRAGIFDGTKPRAPLSREQAALVLDRLHLLDRD